MATFIENLDGSPAFLSDPIYEDTSLPNYIRWFMGCINAAEKTAGFSVMADTPPDELSLVTPTEPNATQPVTSIEHTGSSGNVNKYPRNFHFYNIYPDTREAAEACAILRIKQGAKLVTIIEGLAIFPEKALTA